MRLCFVIHDEERKNRALPTDRRGFSGPPCDRLDHHHRPDVSSRRNFFQLALSCKIKLRFLIFEKG